MTIRPRAVALAVFTVAATLLALRMLESAGRVIGWAAMAGAVAAMLTPVVSWLARRMPRGVAVAVVAIGALAAIAGVVYGLVEDVVEQLDALQRAAPELASDLEDSTLFGDAAREANLDDRVDEFVQEIPRRLRGGSAPEAVRAAATRGLAFLAVTVLTIFLILHGPRLLDAARRQLPNEARRERVARLTAAIEARAVGYARGSAVIALLAGAVAFALATLADVPGPAPLAVWVALWDLVPLVGAVAGAFPIVVLAAVLSPAKGGALAVAFIVWQVVEDRFLQRPLERRTVRVGPFLTVAMGIAGLELYGVAGALLGVFAAAAAVVAIEELAVAPAAEGVPQDHGNE